MGVPGPSNALGIAILKALSVDTSRVLGFTLVFEVNQPPVITVRRHVPDDNDCAVVVAVQKYRVELIEDLRVESELLSPRPPTSHLPQEDSRGSLT